MLTTIVHKISEDKRNINIDALSKLFDKICFLESNTHSNTDQQTIHNQLLALGSVEEIVVSEEKINFEKLEKFISIPNQWKFGYLSYDVKNSIEALKSSNEDKLNFPLLHFFIPRFVFEVGDEFVNIHFDNAITTPEYAKDVINTAFSDIKKNVLKSIAPEIKNKITQSEYFAAVKKLKKEIQLGNIYEINFCHEFYAENILLNPYDTFQKLNSISAAPFACFCKFNNNYILSSSPERFIKKTGNTLISQPIKGTAKRSENKEEDEKLKQELRLNKKEQNENVMIVDLVRNDLSKIAVRGSVKVDELFGIYSFKQVHQLISTISCQLKDQITFCDIIKALFPMGSMTGAPKIRAMQLIEETEKTKRGVYSGCIGFVKPNGDFDFNVVIRTILYNSSVKYASFMVGSAITEQSNAENEYDECLLKAKAMIEILKNA